MERRTHTHTQREREREREREWEVWGRDHIICFPTITCVKLQCMFIRPFSLGLLTCIICKNKTQRNEYLGVRSCWLTLNVLWKNNNPHRFLYLHHEKQLQFLYARHVAFIDLYCKILNLNIRISCTQFTICFYYENKFAVIASQHYFIRIFLCPWVGC